MKPKYVVEIRCDGNPQIGFGHVRRCITLKDRLEKDGYLVNLFGMSGESQDLIDSFLPLNYNNHKSNDLIILDGPISVVDEHLLKVRERGIPSVVLDYFGSIDADYNILIFAHHQYRAKKKAYVGYEYTMIRDEILSIKRKRFPQKMEDNFVLVTIGGGDILGHGHLAAKYLAELGLDVVLASGPLRNCMDIEGDLPYRVSKTPIEFTKLFSRCDWVVTNGGGTLFEALYLNKLVFVLPQTKAEERIAFDMYEKQMIIGIGLENLSLELKNRSNNINIGEKIIDGQGSSRISKIISEILINND